MNRSIIQTRSQKSKSIENQNENSPIMTHHTKQDLWLHDIQIQHYFNSLSKEISKNRNDILFMGPSMSQIMKNGTTYDIMINLTALSFHQVTFAFFCVNNYNDIHEDIQSNYSKG